MASINLAVNIELDTDLSKQELAQLTSALVQDLSRDSAKILETALSDPALRGLPSGSVNIQKLDEAKIAKQGTAKVLDELAGSLKAASEAYHKSAFVTTDSNGVGQEFKEDKYIAIGISTGLSGAAAFTRDAIARL